jgi:hypothetical protein
MKTALLILSLSLVAPLTSMAGDSANCSKQNGSSRHVATNSQSRVDSILKDANVSTAKKKKQQR